MIEKNRDTINFIGLFENNKPTDIIVNCWMLDESYEYCENMIYKETNYTINQEIIKYIYMLLDYQQDCDFEKFI